MSLNVPQVQFKRIKDSKHVEAYSVIGYNNKKVRSIVIPDNYRGLPVISISAGAFKDYKYLKNVILPDTIVSILDDAFKNCSSLFNIHLSSSLSFIGAMAFENCTSLTNIELPDSILFMGKNVFHNCRRLQKLSLPLSFCQRLKDRDSKDILPLVIGCRKLEKISLPIWISLSSLQLLFQGSKPKTLELIDLYLIQNTMRFRHRKHIMQHSCSIQFAPGRLRTLIHEYTWRRLGTVMPIHLSRLPASGLHLFRMLSAALMSALTILPSLVR